MVNRYQCGNSGLKRSILKVPEGIHVKCNANSWIVSPSTKCEVTCSSGSPNYGKIHCKTKGWRPTNQLKCEGVAAGVIVGVLISGLVGVILLAIVYAKYKQYRKKKEGGPSKRPAGKVQSSVRSTKNLVENSNQAPNMKRSASSGLMKSEGGQSGLGSRSNSSWKSDSQGSYPPSYSGLEINNRSAPPVSHLQQPYNYPPYQNSSHPQGMTRYDSGFQGSQYERDSPVPYSSSNSELFYQGQNLGYGFPGNSPPVGYGTMPQTQPVPPTSGEYSKPYYVST